MKYAKRIGALFCVFAFCFTLISSPPAHAIGAIGGQQFGAMIGAALVSLNLIGNVLYSSTVQESVDAMHELQHFIGVPTIQELAQDLPKPYDVYTYDDAAVSEALNTSTIKIRQGVYTIDGKEYDELWVSPEGAQKLKTNAFDFITKYHLIADDTSTLATGVGNYNGMPMYNANGITRTQGHIYGIGVFNDGISKFVFNPRGTQGGYNGSGYWVKNGQLFVSYFGADPPQYCASYYYLNGNQMHIKCYRGDPYSESKDEVVISDIIYNDEPFQYDFVSGEIPAQEEIPDDAGLSIRLPHEDLQQFYEAYPQYDDADTYINIQQDGVDIDELVQAIFSQLESMNDMQAEWTNGEAPEPPTPVDPIENIDQNVEDITQYQKNMQQQVQHMHQDVELMQQTQQQQLQQEQQQLQQQQQISDDTAQISQSIKDATAMPDAEDLPDFKFDLRELFPFCIPFDIYRLLSSFDAEPEAPHVQLPIVIDSINFRYNLDLDFSAWNPVAQAMRTAELIVYAIGLAWATGKVIKW